MLIIIIVYSSAYVYNYRYYHNYTGTYAFSTCVCTATTSTLSEEPPTKKWREELTTKLARKTKKQKAKKLEKLASTNEMAREILASEAKRALISDLQDEIRELRYENLLQKVRSNPLQSCFTRYNYNNACMHVYKQKQTFLGHRVKALDYCKT